MGLKKTPTEGGSGGKRGHSNMEHWAQTGEIKDAARSQRRIQDRKATSVPNYHPHVDDDALDRLLTRFDASLINNTKWVRLLDALTAPPDIVSQCNVKLVWDDAPRLFSLGGAQYRFDYFDDAVEALISGPPSGWYRYREIEWIAFPRLVTPPAVPGEQDLAAIRDRIQSAGQFELADEPGELRLFAYRVL